MGTGGKDYFKRHFSVLLEHAQFGSRVRNGERRQQESKKWLKKWQEMGKMRVMGAQDRNKQTERGEMVRNGQGKKWQEMMKEVAKQEVD